MLALTAAVEYRPRPWSVHSADNACRQYAAQALADGADCLASSFGFSLALEISLRTLDSLISPERAGHPLINPGLQALLLQEVSDFL